MQRTAGAWCRQRRFCLVAAACAAIAGCSTAPPKPDAARVSKFSGHAYTPDEHFGVATTLATWNLGAEICEVALTVPDKAGRFPLVIYLPGLGETRDAGSVWRTAWTQAGYAVFSIQPFAEDAKSWASPKARTGDLVSQARIRYSARVMSARIETLNAAWRELAQRQAKSEAPFARIDLSRVAVAGFDLGAYTAMAMAGETIRELPKLSDTIPVAAVIALSPYADFSGATFSERYRSIHGPVLSVTTDSDADAIGLVTAPSVRKAPFEYMPAGDKFLMLIWGVPHFVLGGNNTNAESTGALSEAAKADSGTGAKPQSGPDTGKPQKKKLPASENTEEDKPAAAITVISATANAIGAAAIAGVTTAFLDAYLKKDAVASEWLDKDAPRWLRDQGEIKKK